MSTDETFLSTPTEPTVDGITFAQFAAPSEVNEYKKLNDSILSEAYSGIHLSLLCRPDSYHHILRRRWTSAFTLGT